MAASTAYAQLVMLAVCAVRRPGAADRGHEGDTLETDAVSQDPPSQRYLFDVVRDVIGDVAPNELPLVDGLRGQDETEIGRRLAAGSSRDDPLGFGAGEVVVLATPIVWGVVQHLANKTAEKTTKGIWERVRDRVRRRKRAPEPLPPFNRAELSQVRDTVVEMAARAGMKPARAEQLAASVVDHLVFIDTDTNGVRQ